MFNYIKYSIIKIKYILKNNKLLFIGIITLNYYLFIRLNY